MSESLQVMPSLRNTPLSSEAFVKRARLRFDLYSRTNQFILDACVFALSLTAAYIFRFEGYPTGAALRQLLLWLPVLVLARISVHYLMGVYRSVWRFVSLSDAVKIAESVGVVTGVLLILRVVSVGPTAADQMLRLPLSIIALEGLLSFTGSAGIRVARRMQYSHQRRRAAATERPAKRVLLYGAGRAGVLLRKELETNNDYDVIGFVDDDPKKLGRVIHGTTVLGSGETLPHMVARWNLDEVVISMATASRQTLGHILAQCRRAKIPAKIIPSVREMLDERAPITQLRELRAEELLGRDCVEVQGFEQAAGSAYCGKRVLVTGAGGSIGSELVRQLTRLQPSRIAILDKDENSVYELEQELAMRPSRVPLEPEIADVRNPDRLRAIFSAFRPQVIFHAAAHKHVPLMERHPCEAVLNNVVGTKNVLEMSAEFGAERFVFISSDKAVNPVNVMGATKRTGELLVQSFANERRVRAACVRFGNVLGSRGSVLPLFQKQIAGGGPVTITHPDVVRYFMTIQEAVQLILCAGTLARNGEIFVLDMGTPRKILELAREMILLSGLEPGKDIEMKITGLRPGEKLSEELADISQILRHTSFKKLSVIDPGANGNHALAENLTALVHAATRNDSRGVYETLGQMGLGFTSQVLKARSAAASN